MEINNIDKVNILRIKGSLAPDPNKLKALFILKRIVKIIKIPFLDT